MTLHALLTLVLESRAVATVVIAKLPNCPVPISKIWLRLHPGHPPRRDKNSPNLKRPRQ
jgi:hypothetical protein